MESAYWSCRGCGSPCHTRDDCPVFRKMCEDEQRRADELDFYSDDDVHPYYSYSDSQRVAYDYQSDTNYYYDEQTWYESSYDPGMVQSVSYQEEYDHCYDEYSRFSYKDHPVHYQDAYHTQHTFDQGESECAPQSHNYYQSPQFRSLMEYRRQRELAYIEKELAKPDVSIEDQLEMWITKYNLLMAEVKDDGPRMTPMEKRQARDRWVSLQMSPSRVRDEVVEVNTTPVILSIVEQSDVEKIIEGDEVKEDIPQNKCGDAHIEMMKVTVKDIERIIIKWLCNNPTYLLILNKKKRLWRVNYRVYVGNSIGKCGLRPDCSASVDILIKIRPRWISDVRYRAFMGNARGKCALRPP
ncbi:putative transcription factor interactor and regulator CCHC(Zn) family [Helianthus annuus]|nr:putative transcription factor interactor and regulator CCHC(Zn) family [Helianthus annuus]